tara:strand:- start:581 stop:733 length:153 start_codon:yes stop_codon:yes gene_type:complete
MKQEKITILKEYQKDTDSTTETHNLIQDSKKETEIWDKLSNEALENFLIL